MEVNETLMYEVNWSHFVTLIVKDFFADRYHLVPTVESRRRRAGIALGQQFGELVFFAALVSYRICIGCGARFGIGAPVIVRDRGSRIIKALRGSVQHQ